MSDDVRHHFDCHIKKCMGLQNAITNMVIILNIDGNYQLLLKALHKKDQQIHNICKLFLKFYNIRLYLSRFLILMSI